MFVIYNIDFKVSEFQANGDGNDAFDKLNTLFMFEVKKDVEIRALNVPHLRDNLLLIKRYIESPFHHVFAFELR